MSIPLTVEMMYNFTLRSIREATYNIDKRFSQGEVFILNKMIRNDPEMRYTSDQ